MKGNINDPSLTIVPAIGQTGLTVELQDVATDPLNTVNFAASDCRVPANGRRAACKIRGARVSIKTSRRPKVKTPKPVHAKIYYSPDGYYSVTGTFRGLTLLENTVVSPLTAALTLNGSVLSDTLTLCYDLARKNGRNTITHCEPGPPVPTPTWTEQSASGSRGWLSIASSSDGTVRVWMQAMSQGARCPCPRWWSHRTCMSGEGSACDARSDASWSTTHPILLRNLPPWRISTSSIRRPTRAKTGQSD
jgi:hypothetical protein